MDLVPLVNGLAADAGAASESISTSFSAAKEVLSANWLSWIVLTIFFVAAFAFVKRIAGRVGSTLEDALFSNWRLALLGSTGLVLSLASGWTTWDGMRNFTNEPVLSFMITFGIQGVMLIVAWLIGESFATGMNTGSQAAVKGGIAGAVIFLLLLAGALAFSGVLDFQHYFSVGIGWGDTAILAIGLVIIAAVLFASGAEMFEPYMASTRVIVRNAVLWIMFLSCMATSVFFSFDSLFSTIFPKEERERAAQLRAQNQVAGIIADIGQTIATQKLRESEALFRSEGWAAYETQLDTLAVKAQDSQKDIEAYFKEQLEERRRAIAEQRNRQSTAKSQQAGLQSRKVQLTEELSRLQSQRPTAANEMSDQQQVVREIERRLDEQRAVVLAEEKGVEGSGKVGKGPMWRAAKAEEAKVSAQLQVANERLRAPRERLLSLDKRIASIKGELARIDGELGNLQGEAQTAEDLIAAAQRSKSAEENADLIDPARILPAFERAKVEFRQDPTKERLSVLQQQCSQLLSGMLATTATKDRVRDIDCDPKQAAEAAGILFTLNRGLDVFAANCASGDKLEANKTTDGLFEFSRKCLADSGLPSQKTDELRTQINLAELNRDDRAHRFVVTWNAFQDGNRLAYLALAIAIAIDALVFMSGLFGANAVRSPLQDVPSLKPRSAKQLEQIVENALLPNKYLAAHATLEAMQPITPVDGFTQEVLTSRVDPSRRGNVIKVLNAGAAIGAVQNDPMRPDERHFVRPELFEYLSIVAKREFEANDEHVHLAELEQTITVALQPYVGDHAHIVLRNLVPITKLEGNFSSSIMKDDVPVEHWPIVNNVLNAGALMGMVQRSDDKKRHREDDYLIHGQLHKTLLRIAATHPVLGKTLISPHQSARPSLAAPGASSADITPDHGRVARSEHSLLPDHTGRSGARGGQRAPSYDDQGANRGIHGSAAGANDGGHYEMSTAHRPLVEHFANELSCQEEELEDIIRLGREVDVSLLSRTLDAVVSHNVRLRDKINTSAKSLLNSLDNASTSFPDAGINPHELYDFTNGLKRSAILFILSNKGAYVNQLETMERELTDQEAEGKLGPQETRWTEFLSRHLSELQQCDRRSLHGWSEVQRSLQRFDTALASLANNS